MASHNLCLLSVMIICRFCSALLKTDASGLGHKLKDYLPGADFEQREPGLSVFHRHEDCSIRAYSDDGHIPNTLIEDEHVGNLTLQFTAFGQHFLVHLHLTKDLFSSKYIRKVSQRDKDDIHRMLHKREHCYYQGGIRDNPKSHAAISTCDGYRGYISDGVETFHIHPVNGTSLHRVFRNSDRKKLPLQCGTGSHDVYQPPTDIFHKHSRRKRSVIKTPYDSNKYTRYVELYLVNDYRTFDRQGKNATNVFKRSQDIANIVNSLYRQLNIYIVLVGVEVWGTGDQISISSSADTTMENFLRYRKERINPYHQNDNAQLITGIFFDHGVVGKAIKGPICTHQFSGGVSMDYDGLVTLVATTVAHEMGHNFGMEHDNDTKCSCPENKCIMAATSGQESPHHWSSCSQNALHEAFELGMDYCLRNPPKTIFEGPVCGNGLVEEGEECDCGLPQDCTNRCCNSTSCQLHPQAECGTGRCCDLDTCKPKASSTLCREPIGECDLPEFCDGTSEYCPPDVYLQNGLSCAGGQSYCYKGKCNTHNAQCQLLWGSTGRVSDPICFQQLNIRGDHDGNCGYNWTTDKYYMCDRENVMCGLLHCVHLNEKLMFWRDNLALDMRANFLMRGNTQYVCRSTMLDVGLDMPDPGLVPDGAKCEDNKICINHACVPLIKLNIPQCPDCHGNGVCNSRGNCHCEVGHAPPLCDRPGYGGSIDSGPATNEYAKRDLLIGLLVLFLVILPLLVLTILAYINRRRLLEWWSKGPRIKFGSLKKSQCPPTWPPQPRPSSGYGEKRWSAAPGKTATNLEISGPLIEDGHCAEPSTPPKPLPPSRPIFTPPVPATAAKALPQPPKLNPPAPRQKQTSASISQVPAVKIAGQDRRSFMGATVVSTPQAAIDTANSTSNTSASVTVTTSDATRPSSLFFKQARGPSSVAKTQKVEEPKPAPKPTVSPPVSPSKAGRKVTHSQSMKEAGVKDKSSLQPGEKIVKRESFRGAEISSPILVSTTNRDSQVFSDCEFDETGTLTRPIHASHSTHSTSDTERDGCRSPVRRSQSDRPLSPKRRVTAADGQGSLGRKNKAFRPRPLPPEPVIESEPLYINSGLSDLTDLKACISSAFDGIDLKLPEDKDSTDTSRPVQPPRPPNSTKSGNTAPSVPPSTTKPSQVGLIAKELVSLNTNKGSADTGKTSTPASTWNKGPSTAANKAPSSVSSGPTSSQSALATNKGPTNASSAPLPSLKPAPSSTSKPATAGAGVLSKGPAASNDKPGSTTSSVLNKGPASIGKKPDAANAGSSLAMTVASEKPTFAPSRAPANTGEKPANTVSNLSNKGPVAGPTNKAPSVGAEKSVSSIVNAMNKTPSTGSSKGHTTSGLAARGPVANALNKALASSLESKRLASSTDGKASTADGKGPASSSAGKDSVAKGPASSKGPSNTAGSIAGKGSTTAPAKTPASTTSKGPTTTGASKGPGASSLNKPSSAASVSRSASAANAKGPSSAPSSGAGRGSGAQVQRSSSATTRPSVAPKPQAKAVRSYNF